MMTRARGPQVSDESSASRSIALPGPLAGFREAEENNFQVSVSRLGNTATLIDDFVDAYQALFRLLRETSDPPEHFLAISLLMLSVAYEFEQACLHCLRGHLTDSMQATRRAIEAGAFAARIARHPHLAVVWSSASVKDDSYDKYREKFAPAKIFDDDDTLLNTLRDRWDSASRQTHTSVYSLARRSKAGHSEDGVYFEFNHFEVDDDDASEPARTFLWTLDTHAVILQLSVSVVAGQLGKARLAAWTVRWTALEAKFGAHREMWRTRIIPGPVDGGDAEDDPVVGG
jgi:hypothetical protein